MGNKKRTIKYIVLHCTATTQETSVKNILNYWQKHLKWKRPGYHYIVMPDGSIECLALPEELTNGVKGYNNCSIHVAWLGGIVKEGQKWVAADNRTWEQKCAMTRLLRKLHSEYPKAVLKGHRDLSPDLNGDGKIEPYEWVKACPCFDAQSCYGNVFIN